MKIIGCRNKETSNSFYINEIFSAYMENPVAIDMEQLSFSWKAVHKEDNRSQSAYRIIISSDINRLQTNLGDAWDTGKVASNESAGIRYGGKTLESSRYYYWKVMLWDNYGNESDYSKTGKFGMGKLYEDDWKANWLGMTEYSTIAPMFRKAFSLEADVVSARAYISALGYYELSLNGQKVGNHVLDPAWTDVRERAMYVVYDVENYLNVGDNIVGVVLGNGWYNNDIPVDTVSQGPQFLFQMDIELANGVKVEITSDIHSGWLVTTSGPILKNSIFHGEVYDARLENPGWDTAEYDVNSMEAPIYKWKRPLLMEPPAGKLSVQFLQPIRVTQEISPVKVEMPREGTYVFDLGQNISGWAQLKVSGPEGAKVVLKHAENVYEDGSLDSTTTRDAAAEEVYILKGRGVETYQPRFTYHGFRYIQVTGYPGKPGLDDITGCVVYSDVKNKSSFTCSNELINQIQKAVLWTEATNLHGVPTDCPQRDERLGWLNDMTVRAEEAIYNFDIARLYAKWVNDITDAQGKKTGAITDVAPYSRYGRRPADPVCTSFLLVPWLVYIHYGDKGIIERNYESIKRWEHYLGMHANNNIIDYSYFGDWAGPVTASDPDSMASGSYSAITSGDFVSTWSYYYNALLIAKMANVLGKAEEAKEYTDLANRIRAAFNDTYLNKETSQYAKGSQASNAFALFLDMVPEANKEGVLANLVKDVVETNDTHLTTGNQCTKYIFDVLTQMGHKDVAYALATQTTYPSWGHMLAGGATTIWERWEQASSGLVTQCCSQNHPMYGSISAWFYKYLAGIQVDEDGAGFSKFVVKPYIMDGLTDVEARMETIKGEVKVVWSKAGNSVTLSVTVPFNSRARIFVPKAASTGAKTSIVLDENEIWNSEKGANASQSGMVYEEETEEYVVFHAGSGSHQFKIA
jgi:alpha-L-rhamnosidase